MAKFRHIFFKTLLITGLLLPMLFVYQHIIQKNWNKTVFYDNELQQIVQLWSKLTKVPSDLISKDKRSFLIKYASRLDKLVSKWIYKHNVMYELAVKHIEMCEENVVIFMDTKPPSPGAFIEVILKTNSTIQSCVMEDNHNGNYTAFCVTNITSHISSNVEIVITLQYSNYFQYSLLQKPLQKQVYAANLSLNHNCNSIPDYYYDLPFQKPVTWDTNSHLMISYNHNLDQDFILGLEGKYSKFNIINDRKLVKGSRVIVIGDSHMRFYCMGILLKLGVHHDFIHPPPGGSHRCGNVSYHWATHVSDVTRHLDEYFGNELSLSHLNDRHEKYIFLISIAHHYLTPPNTTHSGFVKFIMDFPVLYEKIVVLQTVNNVQVVWMTAPPFPDHTFRLPNDPMKTPVIAAANQFVVEELHDSEVLIFDAYSIILPLNHENCRNHYLCIGGLDANGTIIVEGSAGIIVLDEVMNLIASLLAK